jgi:hypothetical protein
MRNVHKVSHLMNFSGTKTLMCPNPKDKPWKTLIGNPRGLNVNSRHLWTKVQI